MTAECGSTLHSAVLFYLKGISGYAKINTTIQNDIRNNNASQFFGMRIPDILPYDFAGSESLQINEVI